MKTKRLILIIGFSFIFIPAFAQSDKGAHKNELIAASDSSLSAYNRLTVYVIPSRVKYNWSSPHTLYRSYIKNARKNLFSKINYNLGHAFLDLQTNDPDERIFTGMRSASAKEKKELIFRDHYGLAILDLADPEAPILLGENSPFWASGIVTSDQYAYLLSDPDGLLVFDISDPGTPKKVGSVITGMGGELEFSVQELIERGMCISEDRLYITDQRDGLIIVDIGDPSSPQLAGVYTTPVSDWLMDIKVRDQFAYLVSRSAGFRVLDVSEPGNLKEIFYDDERKNLYLQVPTALELVENFAFVSDANYPFHVYEISNPGMPTQVSALYDATASDGAKDMVILGSYAYLSGWGGKDAFFPGNGIWVVDISNPAALEAVNFVDLPNKDWSLAIREKTLFAFDGSIDQDQAEPFSLRVLDISNGASPAVVRTIPVPQMQMMSPSDIVAAGDELYLSAGMMGLTRYDITDPQNPVESPVDRSLFPYAFQLHAALPYLVVNGNQVWDVSQPDSPELIGYAMEALEAWNSDIEDDLLFIATKMHGVYVYRIK